jgi:surface polysaccharide O-acyltransferase-like enzyme
MRVAILAVLVVGYAIVREFIQPSWDLWAVAAASASAAVPLLVVAGGGIVLPETHKAALWAAALLCLVACAGEGAMALLH